MIKEATIKPGSDVPEGESASEPYERPSISCSSFCHPEERCWLTDNGICDALRDASADELIGWLEKRGYGWSLVNQTGRLIEVRVWDWPFVAGRYRSATIEPLADMLREAIRTMRIDQHCEIPTTKGGFEKSAEPEGLTEIGADCPSPLYQGLFIVNRYDRPSEEHIAERRPNGYLYYVHPKLRDNQQYWAMNPDAPIPLEDFGIRVRIEGGKLHGKLVDPSRATYLDGRLRRWQGRDEFSFDYPNAQIHTSPPEND
jgi:hypothetical protein